MVVLLLLSSVMIGSTPVFAVTGSATSSAIPSDETPSVGDQITVNINIDVSGVASPDHKLGSFSSTLNWDPAVLAYNSDSGLLAGFTGVVNPAAGQVTFNGANPTGAMGSITVLSITFDVVAPGVSDLDLDISTMAAAETFQSLLPILTVHDGLVSINTWFLSDPEMYFEDASKSEDAVGVSWLDPVIWISDQSTSGGYTFENGIWSGQITLTQGLANGNQFTVYIGSSPSTDPGDFSEAGSQPITASGGQDIFPVSIDTLVEVPAGEHLALMIERGWPFSTINVRVGEAHSYITAPWAEPLYPLPEITAGLLFGLGLVALGITIWYRKRRRVTIENTEK